MGHYLWAVPLKVNLNSFNSHILLDSKQVKVNFIANPC